MSSKIAVFFLILAIFMFAGCATHTAEIKQAHSHWEMGQYKLVQEEIFAIAQEKAGTADHLIWVLEFASAARANNDLSSSIGAFSKAHAEIEIFENQPEIHLAEETSAILTNQSFITYRGYNYDKIMLSVYQALNYMEAKNFENAEVELKRLQNFQRNAERINADRIEQDKKAIENAQKQNAKANYDTDKTLSSTGVMAQLKQIYGDDFNMETSGFKAKELYVNPFAYWLGGLYFMNRPADNSDKNMAADLMRFASESLDNKCGVILSDCKTAEDLANGKIAKTPNVTYLIYESGSAPIRMQFKLNLPLYIVQENIPHVSINFPYLEMQKSYAGAISLSNQQEIVETQLVADMDAIIKREFDDALPMVITKSIISAAVKAAAQYGMKRAAGDGWAGVLVNISASIYQMLMNDADLRTWTTLPKQISIAKISTPETGIVAVDGKTLKLNPEGTNIIIAKKTSANSPLTLRSFDFSDAKKTLEADTNVAENPTKQN